MTMILVLGRISDRVVPFFFLVIPCHEFPGMKNATKNCTWTLNLCSHVPRTLFQRNIPTPILLSTLLSACFYHDPVLYEASEDPSRTWQAFHGPNMHELQVRSLSRSDELRIVCSSTDTGYQQEGNESAPDKGNGKVPPDFIHVRAQVYVS